MNHWALSLAYWIHMLATIVWIGGLAALVLVFLPAVRQTLDAQSYVIVLERIQRRLDPLAWLSLALLVATGMFQMSANPNYEGFLSIQSTWAAAILIKHLLFFGMIAISATLTWGVLPGLRRVAMLQARGQAIPGLQNLQNRERLLLRVNLIFGVLILALTAIARAA